MTLGDRLEATDRKIKLRQPRALGAWGLKMCNPLVDSQVGQSIRLFGDFSSIPFSYDWVIWSQDMMLSLVDLVLLHGCMVLLKNY